MTRPLRAEDGVSILEVLIAMLLVAVAVFAVVREITSSEATTARASGMQVAVATANASIEALRGLPYDRVAVAPPSGTPSDDGAGADVLARVTTTAGGAPAYRVPGGPVEALVDEDPGAALAAFERTTSDAGGRPVRLRVYRFVSWRDEECPVADPARLEEALLGLRTALAGAGRSLEDATRPADAGVRDGTALLAGALPAPLGTAVRGAVDSGLGPLGDLVRPHRQPVRDALAAVEALVDPVTGRLRDTVDLCDVPPDAVPSLADLRAARAALAAVGPAVGASAPVAAATADVLAGLHALSPAELLAATGRAEELTARTTELLGHVAAIGAALEDLRDRDGRRATLGGLLGEVRGSLSALGTFLDAPDHQRNSKRVTVAVVVDGDLAPRRAVWASSVVTDPEEGVL